MNEARYADATVIVFGGSGFIGTHLLMNLSKSGHTDLVSVDIRPPNRPIEGVKYLRADVRDLSNFDLEFDKAVVFNFAAVHTTPGHEPWEYYSTNVLGALEVTRFASRNRIDTIVFTSSISIYGPSENALDESTPPNPNSDYGRSKLMAERIHGQWADLDADRKLIVCRPAVVFGLGEGGNFTRLAKLLKKGFFVYPGRHDTIKSCIYVKDLLEFMFKATEHCESRITFNGCYSDRYTTEDIVKTFKSVAFPKARSFTIPASALRLMAQIISFIPKGKGLGIHPERITKLMLSTNIIPTWAERNGFETKGRLKEAIQDWYDDGNSSFQ